MASQAKAMATLGFLALVLLVSPAVRAAAGGCGADTFSNNRVYAACSDLPHLGAAVHWTYEKANATLSVAFVAAPAAAGGWVAWALNPTGEGMAGSQALVAVPGSGGALAVKTYNITGYSLGASTPIAFPASDLAAERGGDGRIRLFGKLQLDKGMDVVNQVWQVGASVSGGAPAMHAIVGDNLAAKGKLDLVKGISTSTSGGSVSRKRNIHGVLNAVSWGILLPMGAIFARYLKTFKSADPAWFYLHVTCQLIGYGVGVSGWATGLNLGSESKGVTYPLHRNIGIAAFSLGTLQIFALFLRPKKDHKYRVYWNVYHHSVGYTVIILGIINIFKGMSILRVAQKWKTAYIVVICVLGGIALILEAVTWSIVVKRRNSDNKASNGTSNGHLPLSM